MANQRQEARWPPLAAALLLSSSLTGGQDSARDRPDPLPEAEALLSVSRKYAGSSEIGLYVRSLDGRMTRIWEGEPYDARALPDRSVLIVERWRSRVLWLDFEGEVLFEKAGLDRPVDVELARDGTVLVVVNGPGEVLGLDPETGDLRYRRTGFSNPFDASPLADGGLLVADSGNDRIVELGPEGEVRSVIRGIDFPNTVEALDDGSVLVTTWASGNVMLFNARHELVWKHRVDGTVYRAVRQRDGTFLVCDGQSGRLLLLDDLGQVQRVERFRPGCVDYEPILDL